MKTITLTTDDAAWVERLVASLANAERTKRGQPRKKADIEEQTRKLDKYDRVVAAFEGA